MDKRLTKRHKRQVARARERVKLSEPDTRTPDQLRAAREASRSLAGRRTDPHAFYTTPSTQIHTQTATGSPAKPEV